MVALYKSNIWDSFRELMNGIVTVAELLKVSFCQNILIFDNGKDYFIYDVGTMLGQRGEVLKSLHSVWRHRNMSRKLCLFL